MSGNIAFEHGGNLYKAIRQKGSNGKEFLDFSANINPLGLADSVRKMLLDSLECIIHYPDADAHDLKQAIAQFYNIEEKRITAGNGAVELLYILCHIVKPRRVLVTAPTFSEYERAARACGAVIDYCYLSEDTGFAIDVQDIAARIPDSGIIFIGNPNNPTGTLLSNCQLEYLCKTANHHNSIVVIDESFIDFLPDDSSYTCRHMLTAYPNLVIIHSLTKFYAIPGLRLGFAVAAPRLTALLHAGKDPWNVNALAQNAGVIAIQDSHYRTKSQEFMLKAKDDLYADLLTVPGLKPFSPSANFILVNIADTGLTATRLKQLMFQQNILIRDCSNYPGLSPAYIRLAVKLPAQNRILVKTLKQVIVGDSL